MAGHIPVLAREAVQALNLPFDATLVDGTFGRGGHTSYCLNQLGSDARILGIDRDPDAISYANENFADESRLQVVQGRFSELQNLISENLPGALPNGILFDFGVSSPQLDIAERGFAFQTDGPLDMRMDPGQGVSAAEWLLHVSETELASVIWKLGEERFSRRIARAIKQHLLESEIQTTAVLAAIVSASIPKWEKHKHPATRTFQAIRIFINQELEEIESVLPQALSALQVGGRLVVISFHSLEDRLVKRFMKRHAKGDDFPPDLPITADKLNPTIKLIGKAQRAGAEELQSNPRARSATLRVAEKL
ncbi:MAG: 16S rRNA (cytosine1402-N4)-methyltransferase [Parasphingorhabdus sp.]|jgi:16S rRNA (cytosine1402-N4)-methyltransferase